jgi:hypothetical protein
MTTKPLTHIEHAERAHLSTPCNASHMTFGGRCMNCGWGESPRAFHFDYSGGGRRLTGRCLQAETTRDCNRGHQWFVS